MTSSVRPARSASFAHSREDAARRALDRDAQRAAGRRSRSSTSGGRPRRRCRVRSVRCWPGLEAEELAQRVGNVERDGDGVARLALDFRHRQRMEFAHVSADASVRLEVVERLQAVDAAILRLACRRAEARELGRAQRAAARTAHGGRATMQRDRPRRRRRRDRCSESPAARCRPRQACAAPPARSSRSSSRRKHGDDATASPALRQSARRGCRVR